MSITIAWADTKKTVLNCVFEGDYTGDELVRAAETYAAMVTDTDHEFYLLADMSKASGSAIRMLSRFPEAARVLPPSEKRARTVIVVGGSQAFGMVANIFSEVYGGANFVYFADADAVRAYLREAGIEIP
jgi:hypothetical protein